MRVLAVSGANVGSIAAGHATGKVVGSEGSNNVGGLVGTIGVTGSGTVDYADFFKFVDALGT